MKNKRTPSFLLAGFIVVLFVAIGSCVDHKFEPEDEFSCSSFTEVSFSDDIAPIITTNCAIGGGGCHNGDNGPDLDWRVFKNFQDHASDVRDRVTRPVGTAGHMPKTGSITEAQIKLLVCWVEQGAKDN